MESEARDPANEIEHGALGGEEYREMGSGEPPPRRGTELTPREQEELFRLLYDQGLTDREIAVRIGVSTAIVIVMRQMAGLPAHERTVTDRRRKATPVPGADDPYVVYYEQGLVDAEIARQLGVTRAAVYEWRKARKLKANRNRSPNALWSAYFARRTDSEIAAATGIPEATVRNWRYRYDLPAISRLFEEENAAGERVQVRGRMPDYRRYYDLGWNDVEIGAVTNRTTAAVQTWRRKNKLPANVIGHPAAAETHLPVSERPQRRRLTPLVDRRATPVRGTHRKRTNGGSGENGAGGVEDAG